MRIDENSEDGFTLAEMVVTIFIFSIVVTISLSAVIMFNKSTALAVENSQSRIALTNIKDDIKRDAQQSKLTTIDAERCTKMYLDNKTVYYYLYKESQVDPCKMGHIDTKDPNTLNIAMTVVTSAGQTTSRILYTDYTPIPVENSTEQDYSTRYTEPPFRITNTANGNLDTGKLRMININLMDYNDISSPVQVSESVPVYRSDVTLINP